ncbi:hypothetical protein ACQY0O_005973, partial [Thecaphora frezii]
MALPDRVGQSAAASKDEAAAPRSVSASAVSAVSAATSGIGFRPIDKVDLQPRKAVARKRADK